MYIEPSELILIKKKQAKCTQQLFSLVFKRYYCSLKDLQERKDEFKELRPPRK